VKNASLHRILIIFLFSTALLLTGCGGGGGGGGSGSGIPVAANPSTTTISSSNTAKNFIARQIAGTYSSLNNYASASKRKNCRETGTELRASTATKPGVGQTRVTYDKAETVNLWGVNYTYNSGYQDLITRDLSGNLTDNEQLIDSLEISSVNMGCSINDGAGIMNLVYNGKIIFSGFYNATTLTVRAQNLNMAGNINGVDQISWTINGNVSVNENSYPYPVNGSGESGTLVFNGYTYSYTTAYNGSNLASVNFSGAESFTMTVNLATGAVMETSPQSAANLAGSWKLIEENRFDGMAPVKPNASGNVSVIHFYSDSSVKIETIERYTDTSIDYWQSFNVPPKVTHGTWNLSGSMLTLKSGEQEVVHSVTFNGSGLFTQINPFGEKFTWQKI